MGRNNNDCWEGIIMTVEGGSSCKKNHLYSKTLCEAEKVAVGRWLFLRCDD